MIYEGILGVEEEGQSFFTPMGVWVDAASEETKLTLRPYLTSRTGAALLRVKRGVMNYTDDPYLFAQTALTDRMPEAEGAVLAGAYEWRSLELESASLDDRVKGRERWRISCNVKSTTRRRSAAPFNRARNALLESLIIATRAGILFSHEEARTAIESYRRIIVRAGEEREIAAFELIRSSL